MTDTAEQTPGSFQDARWVAITVGNTRSRRGVFRGDTLDDASPVDHTDPAAVARDTLAHCKAVDARLVAVASVNPEVSEPIIAALRDGLPSGSVMRVGVDVPIPLDHRLTDASTLGHDRALNAIAAYARAQQACVVVDAGTAITIDFVDGEGTFAGGAIAPGLAMMNASLATGTARLPAIPFEPPAPDAPAFGVDTASAMRLGVASAARGLLRELLDRYAESYGAYPQVIATGGDAGIFEPTGLVEHVVPDLQLLGVAACVKKLVADDA